MLDTFRFGYNLVQSHRRSRRNESDVRGRKVQADGRLQYRSDIEPDTSQLLYVDLPAKAIWRITGKLMSLLGLFRKTTVSRADFVDAIKMALLEWGIDKVVFGRQSFALNYANSDIWKLQDVFTDMRQLKRPYAELFSNAGLSAS